MLANPRRPSHLALLALFCAALLLAATFADARYLRGQRDGAQQQMRELVGQLQLTDLCLFTEARYTRHLSQADLHSAFGDHPFGIDHYPSASLVSPPAHLTANLTAYLTAPDDRLDRQTTLPD
jgi:hypothetical protein